MDHRQLQFLDALAREHHFGRAAERCHVTQPTLSARIKQLEDELGFPLVERGRRFERFTSEGHRVLEHGRRILREYASLKRESHLDSDLPGFLTIGVVPSATADLMAWECLSSVSTPFRVREYSMITLIQALIEQTIDLAVGYIDVPLGLSDDFCQYPLFSQRMMVYYSQHHYALPESLEWKSLESYPHGMLTKELCLKPWMSYIRESHSLDIQVSVEADSVMTLMMLVARGDVIAVLPQGYRSLVPEMGNIVAQHLPDTSMDLPSIGAIWRRHGPAAHVLERIMSA